MNDQLKHGETIEWVPPFDMHQKPDYRAQVVAWCEEQGIPANEVNEDGFRVVRTRDGQLVAHGYLLPPRDQTYDGPAIW